MATKMEAGARPRRPRLREAMLDSPNPVDIAMAAVASGRPIPDVARRVLEEQADLLHAQRIELRMRHVGETVRAALWAILAVAALAVVGLIALVLVRAARSDTLIVQSFRVPPELATKGLSGEVVATQVLDKLAEMQAKTRSSRSASTYANNWEDDLKIDIPNTGTSTDQVWKLVRSWLGKETRISGEIVEVGTGLALTARVGSEPGRTFVSDKAEVKEIVSQSAESIFKSTQPYRYAIFLGRDGRQEERLLALKQLATNSSAVERKWAFNGLAYDSLSRGRFHEAMAMAKRAVAIDPNMIPAINNAGSAHSRLGHTQQMVDLYRRSLSLPAGKEFDSVQVESVRCGHHVSLGFALRDPVALAKGAECTESTSAGYNDLSGAARTAAAYLRHDLAPALRYRMEPSGEIDAKFAKHLTAFINLIAQIEKGPSLALSNAVEAYRDATSNEKDAMAQAELPAGVWPLEAEALATLGKVGEAQALIAKTPTDCYDCVRIRGLIAQRTKQPMVAQRWFKEAVRQGPRLPAAYLDWARLLASHKRFGGAEARFAKAAKLSPNWADPLKYWGDALAAQGKRKEALAKYGAAAKLAPKWVELQQARSRTRAMR